MSKKFFQKLYVPPLVKAGNKRARMMAVRASQIESGKSFSKRTPEERSEAGRRGGKASWAKLNPEQRRARGLLSARGMRQSVSHEKRSEMSTRIAKAMWDAMTPDRRAVRAAQATANCLKYGAERRAKRVAAWPFPDGPGALWLSMKERGLLASKANSAAARLRKFRARR